MTKTDFGIITAISCETTAVLKYLKATERVRGILPDIRDYFVGRFPLKGGKGYRLVVVQCTQAGNSDAGQAAKDLITRWNPNYLIMFGVAGGFSRGGIDIGDVVIATEIVEYDYKRYSTAGFQPRFRHHPTSALLLSKLNHVPAWNGSELQFEPSVYGAVAKPKLVKPGPIAAGNSLFADAVARDKLLSFQQDLIAVEMESEGVAVAAWQREPPMPVFVVRGICDLADGRTKGNVDEGLKGLRQKVAAMAASSFLFHFLKDEPVTPNDVPPPVGGTRIRVADTTTPKPLSETSTRKESFLNLKDSSVLTLIEPEPFIMGSYPEELGAYGFEENPDVPTELIAHTVRLDPFWIGKFPITNAQYRKFIEETGYIEPERWDDPNFNGPKHPVIGVSWDDAIAYLEWAGLRLPTEAEWEYVAYGCGRKPRLFPWGDSLPDDNFMNFGRFNRGTTPVSRYTRGTTPDNGIMDLAGNVLEWCLDDTRAYTPDEAFNPTGSLTSSMRAIRGGSFARPVNSCRASYRDRRFKKTRWGSSGFRPAYSGIINK